MPNNIPIGNTTTEKQASIYQLIKAEEIHSISND